MNKNKIPHAVVLVFVGCACWFLSVMFKMPVLVGRGLGMPPFARLCVAIGPFVAAGLALLALGYCIYIWTRKGENRRSNWIGFLATSSSALLLLLMATVVAMYITVVDVINRLGTH